MCGAEALVESLQEIGDGTGCSVHQPADSNRSRSDIKMKITASLSNALTSGQAPVQSH